MTSRVPSGVPSDCQSPFPPPDWLPSKSRTPPRSTGLPELEVWTTVERNRVPGRVPSETQRPPGPWK